MKRLVQITLFLLLIISGLISALPLLLSTETMRERIIAHVANITPGKVSFQSNPSISFNPFLGIEVSDFKVQDALSGDETSNLLTVEKVKAKLDILPALLGQVAISEYQLLRPKLNLKVYTDGKQNWQVQETRFGEILNAYEEQQAKPEDEQVEISESLSIGSFDIVDGVVEYEDQISGGQHKITGIDGAFNWGSTDGPMSFSGISIWRGEIIDANLNLEEPLKVISNGVSALSLSVESNPLNLTFSGQVNMLAKLFVSGDAEFSTPSVNRFIELLELDAGGYSNMGSVTAAGAIEATPESLTLTNANISIDEDAGQGVLTVSRSEVGDISLDGTLAFEQINADTYLNLSRAEANNEDKQTLKSSFVSDLRLSAKSFVSGALTLTDMAANVSTRGYEWTFDISDALVFDGHVIAQLGERIVEGKYQNFIDINARDVNIDNLTDLLPESHVSLTGKGNVEAMLTTNYNLETSFIERLNGNVILQIESGSIIGLDINSLMQNSGVEPNNRNSLDKSDTTPFENLDSEFTLNNGVAYITKTAIKNSESAIKLAGSVNMSNQAWVLRAASDGTDSKPVVFGGTISAPLILYTPETVEETPPEVQTEDQNNDVSN